MKETGPWLSQGGPSSITTGEFLRNASAGGPPQAYITSKPRFQKQVLQAIRMYAMQFENHWMRPKLHLRNSLWFQTQGK